MTYLLLVVGFVLLIKGADVLVDGAVSFAKRFRLSDMAIGLTIVSFGTSMPELMVGLFSTATDNSQIAMGNVLGSNVANILLVLGVSAIVFPIKVERTTVLTEVPLSLVAALLVGFFANVAIFHDVEIIGGPGLSQIEGSILLFFFVLFLIYIARMTEREDSPIGEVSNFKVHTTQKAVLLMAIGSICLFLGGKWVVESAVEIAEAAGLSRTVIGLTVVAIGTSLPELVTSVVAAAKKNSDIAVGNVVGSNIFNMLWILGLSSVIKPLPFDKNSNADIMMIVAASTLLILAIGIGRRNAIDRMNGVMFLVIYIAYIYYLVVRG